MKIYITRHSLTTWNEEKRLQGWKNSDLTKQGLEDAKRLGNYLKNQSFDGIYSSPLKRAKETAQLIFPNKTIIEDDRLKEMNFGDYEGKFIDELKKEKDYYTLWNEPQGDFSIKNGETYQEVVDRVLDFIEEKYKENKKCIFITIHGMLFTVLNGLFLNLPIEHFNEVNQNIARGCSLSLFEYNGKEFKIDYIGKDDFLESRKTKISYK